MKVRFGAHTDTGRVRDHNEDTLLARPPVFAVADGMGGHEAGEVASSLAVATVESADLDAADPENWVGHVVDSANTAVFAKGAQRGGALRMGTTLTVAYTAPDAIYLGHVGDSRAYMLHDGRLRQLTDDHSLVAEWVRQGRITAEEAAVHPQRSVITRALGIDDAVEIDTMRVVPVAGDRLLLCSDGLTGCVSGADIAATLRDVADPDDAARKLIELANAGGGDDNITAVIVDVVDDPVPSSPPPLGDAPTEVVPTVADDDTDVGRETEAMPVVAATSVPSPAVIEHPPPPEREPPAAVRKHRRRGARGEPLLGAVHDLGRGVPRPRDRRLGGRRVVHVDLLLRGYRRGRRRCVQGHPEQRVRLGSGRRAGGALAASRRPAAREDARGPRRRDQGRQP